MGNSEQELPRFDICPNKLEPIESPYQRGGGGFLHQWSPEMRSRVREFAEAHAMAFIRNELYDGFWSKRSEGCGSRVEEHRGGSDVKQESEGRFRVTTVQPIAAESYDFLGVTYASPEKVKFYSKTVDRIEAIAKVSKHCDVFRVYTKPALFGLISMREYTDVLCTYRCGDAHLMYSTQAPAEVLNALPVASNVVRGRDVNVLTLYKPSSNHSESVMQLDIRTDVGGSLPSWMINKALPHTLIDTVKMCREMMVKFPTFGIFLKTADLSFVTRHDHTK